MTPIIIPMLMHHEEDRRPRCGTCGQVLPEPEGKWDALVFYTKFFGWLIGSVGGFFFAVWTVFAWLDPNGGHSDETLVQVVWGNLQLIWHLMGRIF